MKSTPSPQLPYDLVEALADNPDVAIHRRATGQATFWSFNLTIPPYDDVRVRQAIVAAMDYDGFMENLVGDSGVRMNTPSLPPCLTTTPIIP